MVFLPSNYPLGRSWQYLAGQYERLNESVLIWLEFVALAAYRMIAEWIIFSDTTTVGVFLNVGNDSFSKACRTICTCRSRRMGFP